MQKVLLGLFSAILLVSCNKESIRGSGTSRTESRSVPAFSGVRIEGRGDATVMYGQQQKLEVTGYENLLPIYETFVSNGTLVLKFRNDYNIRNSNVSVSITIPALHNASINGSGKISISNFNTTSLEAEINGSGDIYSTSNTYITTRLLVNGSGYIRGREISSDRATVRISGSGKVDVTVKDKLDASIQGSGEVNYWGQPTEVTSEVNGSGSVRKK